MARPPAEELTDRELEVMHAVWAAPGEVTVADLRDALARGGRPLATTTVSTLVKILHDKGFLRKLGDRRPFVYRAARGFEEVSRSLVGELVRKVFGGSREALLARLVDDRLTAAERALLEGVLNDPEDPKRVNGVKRGEGAGDE